MAQPALEDVEGRLDSDAGSAKWLTVFPEETAFPSNVKILAGWDLTEAAANIHLLHLQLRTDICVHAQAIKLCTTDFEQAIPKLTCYVGTRFLGPGLLPSSLVRVQSLRGSPLCTASDCTHVRVTSLSTV